MKMTKFELEDKVKFHSQELKKYQKALDDAGDGFFELAQHDKPFKKFTLLELDSLSRINERAYAWFTGDEENEGHKDATIEDFNKTVGKLDQVLFEK